MSDTQSDPTLGPWEMDEPGSNRWEIFSTGTSRRFNRVAVVYAPKEDGRIDREKGIVNARLIAAAGTAAHELPREYDAVAAVEALPTGLERVRRAIIDLLDGPPGDTDEPAIRSAISRLVEFLDDAGDEDVSEIVDDMMLDAARGD